MKGARDYYNLFNTGTYGKLYIVCSSHARGKTFRIFIKPAEEDFIPNGSHNAPLNKGAVEVYGVVRGNRGWTEEYGWIHEGPWADDFNLLVEQQLSRVAAETTNKLLQKSAAEQARKEFVQNVLNNY